MPPRYSYWTILAGGLPTAFRAAERADLLPTFNRIREKHPDAEMKWFARGRVWASPEEAQADLQRARIRRDRDWRPGGDHRDPREAFKNKRKRDAARRQQASRRSPSRLTAPSDTRTARPPLKPTGPSGKRTALSPSKPTGPSGKRTAWPPSKPTGPSGKRTWPPSKPSAPAGKRTAWPPSKPAAADRRPARPPKRRPQ
jgi:hypothetical protein